ncbi:zinc ribbon domain-containing protein [Desertibacillus haloalkaliphilus]|uniref:zinc ribbon domain-containing protein n=1 Tax=Desertibacillus haloalkaliphilus TaxID=1328930 RepID=UPI001C25FF45|nr:zinc ribbon domain-containing protein [Desertibacillus haloalkaliphilus]MBU8906519.1 zinc ribbon domain-containing protein [Desertibacillus haloalkaliphilus]
MNCPNCDHLNDGGKFCVKCGTKLVSEPAASYQPAPNQPQVTYQSQPSVTQQNQHLEQAKQISKSYWGFFIKVLKKPYSESQTVGGEQFVNAMITVAIYALFIPLMIYFGFKDYLSYMDSPFVSFVVKPTLAYAVFILLVASFTFVALKLGKVNVGYKDVLSRFGTILIPFVGLFAVALVLSLLQVEFFLLLLVIGFIGSIFTVPPLVISSFKKGSHEGLDVVYGTILTYIATIITVGMMSDMLFEVLRDYIQSMFMF